MVEHKRLVSRVKRQRKSLSSSYRDEKIVEPIPNRANFQSRVLGTLLMLFCLKGLGFLCPPSFPTFGKTRNLKSKICVLLAVFLPLVLFSVTAQAADGDLQLCDITVTDSCTVTTDIGRLEVHYDGEWAGVCDDYFTDDEAEVACRQLTYNNPEFAKTLRKLDGPSLIDPSMSDRKTNNKFWLDDILCAGNETRLIDCPRHQNVAIGTHNCRSSEHAGVICSITAPDPPWDLEAEPGGQSMITLRWRAPNSYVEGYKIEVSEDGVNNWTDLEDDTGNTDTTYTHSGLSPGDTRHYRVSAINSEGTSDPSNIADATIPGPVGNRAPEFSAASAARSVAENTLAGVNIEAPVTATDPDNDTLSYSLEGLDAASFDIVSSSGQLKTKVVPNYETKSSYSVTVKATDPSNASDTITVTISVTNVDESGTVTFSYPSPFQVNEVLTATLSDPDGSATSVTWMWHRSTDQNNWGNPISGATSANYMLVVADEAHYLRATATYTDAVFGSGKSAEEVSTKVPNLNWPPMFEIPPPTFSVPENTAAEVDIGTPVTAADQEMDPLTYSLDDTDGASFDIGSSTGQIETKAPLDFETKSSYSVTVTARDRPVDDPEVQSDTITVTITVTNEEEPGEVTLSSVQPQVDTLLKATLTDPDGSVSGEMWTWERLPARMSPEADRTTVSTSSGATTSTYTPVAGDVDNYLRAKVTYTDGHGSGKMAYETSDRVVRVEPPSNNAPSFSSPTRPRVPWPRTRRLEGTSVRRLRLRTRTLTIRLPICSRARTRLLLPLPTRLPGR